MLYVSRLVHIGSRNGASIERSEDIVRQLKVAYGDREFYGLEYLNYVLEKATALIKAHEPSVNEDGPGPLGLAKQHVDEIYLAIIFANIKHQSDQSARAFYEVAVHLGLSGLDFGLIMSIILSLKGSPKPVLGDSAQIKNTELLTQCVRLATSAFNYFYTEDWEVYAKRERALELERYAVEDLRGKPDDYLLELRRGELAAIQSAPPVKMFIGEADKAAMERNIDHVIELRKKRIPIDDFESTPPITKDPHEALEE